MFVVLLFDFALCARSEGRKSISEADNDQEHQPLTLVTIWSSMCMHPGRTGGTDDGFTLQEENQNILLK